MSINFRHPHPKVVGVIDNMLWALELEDDFRMQQINARLHHIYAYIKNSHLDGQPLFDKFAIDHAIDVLANEIGRKIADGELG